MTRTLTFRPTFGLSRSFLIVALATATLVVFCALGAQSAFAATCNVPSGTYATINSALADNTCSTINVAAGTYDEALNITRDVAIHGAGAATTTIAPTSLPTEIVGIRNGANVEIDGFTIRYPSGFYQSGATSAQSIGVHVYEGATADVHDNVITQIHNDVVNGNQTGHCVMVGNNSPVSTGTINLHDNTITYCQKQGVSVRANSTATITDNEIAYGNRGEGKVGPNFAANGIVLNAGDTATISGNNIHDWLCTPGAGSGPPCGTNPFTDTQSLGILPFGTQASLTVVGNNVHNNDAGYIDYGGGANLATVTGNSFTDNTSYNAGILGANEIWTNNTLSGAQYGLMLFGAASPDTDLNLNGGNTITGASVQGAYVDTSAGAVNVSGSKNAFISNNAGIDLSTATSVNLTCNWWGSTTGPTVASNPGGTGDPASSNTIYSPWAYNDTDFSCVPPTPTPAVTTPKPAAGPIDPIPTCVKDQTIITGVSQQGDKVRVRGVARLKYAGKKIVLRSQLTGSRVIARPTVKEDGSFSALVKAPVGKAVNSGHARYQAAIGGDKTKWIKLKRRMGSTVASFSKNRLVIKGSVKPPFVKGARVYVTISNACGAYRLLATMALNPTTGQFSGAVPLLANSSAALVRLRVKARRPVLDKNGRVTGQGKKVFSTYSIIQPVVLN